LTRDRLRLVAIALAAVLSLGQALAEPPDFRRARTLEVDMLSIHDAQSLPSWTPATLPDARKLLAIFAKGQPSVRTGLDSTLPMSTYIQMFVRLDGRPEEIVVDLPLPVAYGREPYRFHAFVPLASRVGVPIFTLSRADTEALAELVRALLSQPRRGQSASPRARPANAVVAPDGTSDYKTVQDAIDAVPQNTSASNRWVIFIKAGIYRERIYVQREKRFVSLVGEDPARTILTYNLNATMPGPDGKPIGTFRPPSTQIDADDFIAENLSFENSAGPVGQALALRVDGDRVVFRNCRFLGWQDTIFLNRGRHYFEDSYITGHVDFIFGGATAYFERCHLHCRRNGYITAASTPREERYGFVFANGRITGEPDVRTYLGRPWRDFAQVTFINTNMSEVVRPEGWHDWDRPEREKTARYSEFGSTGPGADQRTRVTWSNRLSAADAKTLSPTSVLRGSDNWDPMHP
jgi:pectinesterase